MIFVYVLLILVPLSNAQDIVFPSDAARQSHNQTMEGRMKKECPINMTMIKEDGESDCECVFGYLYYPPLDRCFKPYTRGPCDAGEYFILQEGKSTAECLLNPCDEGSVYYENSCHKLLKPGPPCDNEKSLIINEETFKVTCQILAEKIIPMMASPSVIVAPISRCRRGSKKDYKGRCRNSI